MNCTHTFTTHELFTADLQQFQTDQARLQEIMRHLADVLAARPPEYLIIDDDRPTEFHDFRARDPVPHINADGEPIEINPDDPRQRQLHGTKVNGINSNTTITPHPAPVQGVTQPQPSQPQEPSPHEVEQETLR